MVFLLIMICIAGRTGQGVIIISVARKAHPSKLTAIQLYQVINLFAPQSLLIESELSYANFTSQHIFTHE